MHPKKLSPLEARKQMLIAESEINRELLSRDYQAVAESVHQATEPVREIMNSVSVVLGLFKSFGGHKKHKGKSSSPWWWTGLKTGWEMWTAYRNPRAEVHSQEE